MQSKNKCIDCKECKACHCPSDIKHNSDFCEQVKNLYHLDCEGCKANDRFAARVKVENGYIYEPYYKHTCQPQEECMCCCHYKSCPNNPITMTVCTRKHFCSHCQPQNEAKEEICNFCLTPGDQGAPIHPHSMTTHKQSNNGTTK